MWQCGYKTHPTRQCTANAFPCHYKEARFMLQCTTCTRSDIIEYRRERQLSGQSCQPLPWSNNTARAATSVPSSLGQTLVLSDIQTFGTRSSGAQELHEKLENSLLMTPVSRKVGQFWTKVQQETYSEVVKKNWREKRCVHVLTSWAYLSKIRTWPKKKFYNIKEKFSVNSTLYGWHRLRKGKT